MASSRTGTAAWINRRRRMIAEQKSSGKPCEECGKPFIWDVKLHPQSPEIDHIRPVAQGGTDDRENLRVIHRLCNQSLGGKTRRRTTPATPRPQVTASPIW